MTSDTNAEKAEKTDAPALWVIIRSKNNLFGYDASQVINMVAIPKITHIPGRVSYMPGTITIRNSVIPLIDLRVFTGQPSADKEIEDFCSLMDQRLLDHQNWVKELKNSVNENRQFTLTTDPHKCAFGKWYDNYKSDDRTVKTVLAKFDRPHRTVHAIAEKVEQLTKEGNNEEAHEVIDRTAHIELARLVTLFSEIKTAVREAGRRRIAMVLDIKGKKVAFDVDEVVSVEKLTNIEEAPTGESQALGIHRIARTSKSDELVLLMEDFQF